MLLKAIRQLCKEPAALEPTLVGTASASGSSTLSLTGITDLQEGDLVLFWGTDDSNSGVRTITSSGWTTAIENNNNSIQNIVAYKVMGSTVDTSVSVSTTSDALTATAWRSVEWGGLKGYAQASSNTVDPISFTVAANNSVVIILGAIDDDSSTISSPPTGYTIAVENGRLGGSNAQMYKTGVSAGTEDPSSYTWSSTDALISRSVALSPTGSGSVSCLSFGGGSSSQTSRGFYVPLDYEGSYGTPDYTITSFSSTDTGVSNSYDVIVAVDANISSTDDGILFDLGGAAGAGMSAGVNNGTLRARAFDSSGDSAFSSGAGQAHVEVDISSYTGADATYYFVVDASTYTLTVYVQEGGAGSASSLVQLGTDTADGSNTTVYGGNDKGYGTVNGSAADLGSAYEVDFTGTIDEIRIWTEDATLDVSGFGS